MALGSRAYAQAGACKGLKVMGKGVVEDLGNVLFDLLLTFYLTYYYFI